MNPFDWVDDKLQELDCNFLLRRLRTRDGSQSPLCVVDGHRLLNFGSNDYLGLAAEKRLIDAVIQAVRSEGWGSGASPLITGYTVAHRRLEKRIAEFENTEAAILFASGYAANVGTVTSLVGRGDLVLSDANNHASIIDGCRLSGARIRVYQHADVDFVDRMLAQAGGFRRRLIVTDSLFSMDGDFAPLVELVDLARRYDAMLMIDEAHATGVFGSNGRGVAEHLNVEQQIPVRVGTLSKALGCSGGFVVGSQKLIDWLTNTARPYIFSTAHPAAGIAAAEVALQIVRNEPQRRWRLNEMSAHVRENLVAQGWNVGPSRSQIIPVITGDPNGTMSLATELQRQGILIPGIRPPSVPEGQSLLRLSLSSAHTDEMIDQLIETFSKLAH